MSQQVLPQYAPMVKAFDENNQEVYIPAAIASGQTRDGKDELIVGAGNMVFDPTIGDNGMWVPVSEANPLETRVRHLETLIGAITESPAANTVQARLKTLADRLGEAVEEPDENTLLGRIAQLETELTNIKNTLTDGTQKTTLTGQTVADVPDPQTSEINGVTLTEGFPNNVADLQHSNPNAPITIDWALVSSDNPLTSVLLIMRDAGGVGRRRRILSHLQVSILGTPRLAEIQRGTYPGWTPVLWDEARNVYMARLEGPIYLPFGGAIRLQASSDSYGAKVSAVWSYRVMEGGT